MSIRLQQEIHALERRVTELEKLVESLLNAVTRPAPQKKAS